MNFDDKDLVLATLVSTTYETPWILVVLYEFFFG